MPKRECGDCTLCCKLIGVAELDKPSNVWCKHCDIGHGCKIYETRPDCCRQFVCMWLQGLFGEEMKPSKSKAVLFNRRLPDGEEAVQVHVDVGRDWHGTPVEKAIDKLIAGGIHVFVIQGTQRKFMCGKGRKLPEAISKAMAK